MRSQAEYLENDMHHGLVLGDLCLLYALLGQAEEAHGVLDENRDVLPKVGEANILGSWELACCAAEAMALAGFPEENAALYPAVAQLRAGGAVMTYSLHLVERVLGIAAACQGRWDRAEEHFASALHQAETRPHLPERAEVRLDHARALLRRNERGDSTRARELLGEATKLFREMGLDHRADTAEAVSR